MKPRKSILPLLGLWFLLVALACNLSTSPEVATVVPRPTVTPVPTLGFSTLSPEELPQQITEAPISNFELLNILNQVDSDRLMVHIDTLQNFGTRHVNSGYDRADWGIGAAYQYIRQQFDTIAQQNNGNLVVFDRELTVTWAGVETRPRNIIAYLQGTEIGAGVILVGAHYDSISFDPEDGTLLAPGANDNGSGIAAMLEMARILSTRPHRSTIMFVAFSAEEIGRKGSIDFVNGYIRSLNIPVVAMLNMDIIGSNVGRDGSVNDTDIRVYSAGDTEMSPSRVLARAIEFYAFNNFPDMRVVLQGREDREGRYSDHLSFSEAGFAAVRFVQALEDTRRQHSESDTIDGINAAYLTRATKTILSVIVSLADGLRPPQTVHIRNLDNGLRRLLWDPVPGAVSYIVALRRPGSLRYDQMFPINDNFVDWERFIPSEFAGVAVAARDNSGLVGPLSAELLIP